MAETGQNFEVYQGDSKVETVVIRDENAALLNLAGYTFNWVMFRMNTRENVLTKTLASGLSVPTPSNGECLITLDPADTVSLAPGKYNHELEMTSSGGDVSTVTTGIVSVLYSQA